MISIELESVERCGAVPTLAHRRGRSVLAVSALTYVSFAKMLPVVERCGSRSMWPPQSLSSSKRSTS